MWKFKDPIHVLFFTPKGKKQSIFVSSKVLNIFCFGSVFYGVISLCFVAWGCSQFQEKKEILVRLQDLRKAIFLEQVASVAHHDLNNLLEPSGGSKKSLVQRQTSSDFVEWSWIDVEAEKIQDVEIVGLKFEETDDEWVCRLEIRNLNGHQLRKGIIDALVWYEGEKKIWTVPTLSQSEGLVSGKRYTFKNFGQYELRGLKPPQARAIRVRVVLKDSHDRQIVLDPLTVNALT